MGAVAIALAVVAPRSADAQASAPAADTAPADKSRLVIGPTGRMLAPGQGYIAFDEIFAATLAVGVTRQFTMGAGILLLPTGGDGQPFWITPKVQLYGSERTNVAAGFINLFIPGEGFGGLAYTVGTIGTMERSVTLGGAVLYGKDDDSSSVAPLVIVGGERRFMPQVSFITENYVGPHGGSGSAGVRWRLRDWQVSLAGLVAFVFDEGAVPGLWFSFAYKFRGE